MSLKNNKELKKKMKAQYKQNEQDKIRTSIPMDIDDLKDLMLHLKSKAASGCDHTLRETIEFLNFRQLNPTVIAPLLREHGGFCDCEVICNVYNDIGNIVGWHLDEDP